jgi:hypothetical protein
MVQENLKPIRLAWGTVWFVNPTGASEGIQGQGSEKVTHWQAGVCVRSSYLPIFSPTFLLLRITVRLQRDKIYKSVTYLRRELCAHWILFFLLFKYWPLIPLPISSSRNRTNRDNHNK